jgi:GTP pyrophosphokinase
MSSEDTLPPLAVDWLSRHQNQPRLNLTLLTDACRLVNAAGNKIPSPYSVPMLTQGLEMADELLALNCDTHTLAAAISFPALYYQQPTPALIEKYLPADIHALTQGVKKMDAVQQLTQEKNSGRADNLRKMCLAMVDDVRIVLIKLAEKLVILKHLRHCEAPLQQQVAQQVMNIYAPLANRLGVGQMKWQMEDWAFRYLNPIEYHQISKALNMRRQDREIFINNFIARLQQLLAEAGVTNVEISGRAKHIYSIYRKIQRKRVEFSQIYDTSAVRVLVKTIEDCYKTLSIAHSTWQPIYAEFDDYIARPKPNGYRSIHTVIVSPENINVEIQVRTYQMHEESELGVAAHWQYKEAGGKPSSYADKINWLRHIMDWQKEVSTPQDNLYHKIFEDRVYVFTPEGDVFDLESGATPLDFAYHVHTELGHRCRGAKVNDMIVPLTQPLRTGDQVSILTGKESLPSRDWANPAAHYLKTTVALQKVRSWFKRQEQQKYLAQGQALWEKLSRRENITKPDLEKAVSYFKFKNQQELFIAIGSGTLGAISVLNKIKHPEMDEDKKVPIIPEKTLEKPLPGKPGELQIEGVGNLLTQLARCCRPIPGDAILGYITKGRGITIHQQDCRNIQFSVKRHPERLFTVSWGAETADTYQVEIRIEADDRAGLIRDISNIIAAQHLSLLGLNTRVDKLENRAYISLTIEIKSLTPLKKILLQLQQIPGVTTVQRT